MRQAKNFTAGLRVRMQCFSVCMLLIFAARPALPQAVPPASPSQPAQSAPPPAKPDAPAKKPSPADDNPFPEDISKKAAEANDAPSADKPAASSSNGKAPETDSSSRSKFEGLPDLTDNSDRISNGAGGYVHNPKLAADDVKIGGFYLGQHDYKGAYVRFKEATRVDPENADAVFGLAEAARGLKQNAEAVQNYLVYLDASPDGKKAKEARKALSALGTPAPK